LAALAGRSPNDRDHRKIMVVDGRIGFVGGINLARVYENQPGDGVPADGDADHAYWRDTAVEIRGPAVAELQRLFFATWKNQKGGPIRAARYPVAAEAGRPNGAHHRQCARRTPSAVLPVA
jgi:cardiolipin synthase A/B